MKGNAEAIANSCNLIFNYFNGVGSQHPILIHGMKRTEYYATKVSVLKV